MISREMVNAALADAQTPDLKDGPLKDLLLHLVAMYGDYEPSQVFREPRLPEESWEAVNPPRAGTVL